MSNDYTNIVRFHETGPADVLKLEKVPLLEPDEGEIRLKVEAIGLNRAEIMFRNGAYLEQPQFPSRLGYEAAGTIDAIGSGITDFRIGDRVSTIPSFQMGKYGVYGETAIVPAYAITHYPPNLTAIEGAAIWMQYLTAYGALIHYAQLTPNQVVLITAASSSVGLAAIQLTKAIGATAIATTRGAGKKQFLLDAGADSVVVTDEHNLVKKVLESTGGSGANIIFDPIGGPLLESLAEAAASQAVIIEYGALSTSPTPFPLFPALSKGLVIRGYTLFEITKEAELRDRARTYIFNGLESGELSPIIDKTFTLENIVEAHEYMESNQQTGKIVVTVP